MGRVMVAYATRPAHDLLREAAARFHGVPAERVVLVHGCPRCGSAEHGRPFLLPSASLRRPAYVSLARAGALSVVAVTDVGEAGVDVEREGAAAFEGFAGVALHPSETGRDSTRTWVRKEAVLKAYGVGLAVDPADLVLDAAGQVVSGPLPPGAARIVDVQLPGHVAAVAVVPDDGRSSLEIDLWQL